ncbi:hypothetical protein BKI52_23605 [marine bacterium AO1-C]|nr:hypothetical protein BKI52_23605 [marine bacterium AO1-C]
MIDQQSQILAADNAQTYLQKWQGDAFQNLLDSFHVVKTSNAGVTTHHRVHTYLLDGAAATQLLSDANTKSLRVYLSVNPATNKFVFLLQGVNNGQTTDFYATTSIEDKLTEAQNLGSPINPNDTIIPFSLAKLYADQWNRCAPNDLISAFHAPIDIPIAGTQQTIKESQRVRFYTYSSDDTSSLQQIVTNNAGTLKVDQLFVYLGSGDPNPEYDHPFSFRPILRLVMKPLDDGVNIDRLNINVPPHVKFTNLEGGGGGATTMEFAKPCPTFCGSGGD